MRHFLPLHLRISAILCGALLIGCRGGVRPPASGYYGPTEPLSLIVEKINRNNQALPTLWSRGSFEAYLAEGPRKNGQAQRLRFLNGDVRLLYRQPVEFRLVADKDIAGRIFDIGTNEDRFWLIAKGDIDTMWWGSFDEFTGLGTDEMPIRPDLLLEVLGVGPVNPDLTRQPVPTLRFNNDVDVYMLTWNVRAPDRWLAQKEVWYDRQTLLPKKVLLFDEHGRVVLRGDLLNHRPVDVEDLAPDRRPRVATVYRLFFPDTGSTMRFNLTDVELSSGGAPNDKSFAFPERPGVSRTIQIK